MVFLGETLTSTRRWRWGDYPRLDGLHADDASGKKIEKVDISYVTELIGEINHLLNF
jgi:hypothetical protein